METDCDRLNRSFWQDVIDLDMREISGRFREARDSRENRVRAAFVRGVQDSSARTDQQLFDSMWLGRDVNAQIIADLQDDLSSLDACEDDPKRTPLYDVYDLYRNARLLSLYGCFGSGSSYMPNRLSRDAERTLLEVLWRRTVHKNDIAIARNSTWWLAGSENHDLNTKTANLVSSAIFAAEPDYAARVYPNKGAGDGYGYMEPGPGAVHSRLIAEPHANWSDGGEYTPQDHHEAWIEFFKEYLRERVRRGFFLENGSPTYMKVTVSYLLLLRSFCGNDELRRLVTMFLDLFWADWAVQQLSGLRGGPKTRHHHSAGGYDSMSNWARFYLGGPGCTESNYAQQLISDYEWPEVLWELALDRQGRRSFEYVARGVGEEETALPRPVGTERTMLGATESRMVKYSWVTPEYVLGTQMDHPLAVHNHLSAHGRWQGLVTGYPESRVVLVSLEHFPGKTLEGNDYCVELMCNSVQNRQVLVTQQRRRWTQINPGWFPSYEHLYDVPIGVYIGSGWDALVEEAGWLFLSRGEAFVAIRILRCKADPDPMAFAKGTDRYRGTIVLDEESFHWNDERTIMVLENKFSPVIIEAGSRSDYGDLERFQKQIVSNRLEIHRTVATYETRLILVYEGRDAEEIVYNAANVTEVPLVGGAPLEYSREKTFDCPFIQDDHGSGVVEVRKGQRRLRMDFNQAERIEELEDED